MKRITDIGKADFAATLDTLKGQTQAVSCIVANAMMCAARECASRTPDGQD